MLKIRQLSKHTWWWHMNIPTLGHCVVCSTDSDSKQHLAAVTANMSQCLQSVGRMDLARIQLTAQINEVSQKLDIERQSCKRNREFLWTFSAGESWDRVVGSTDCFIFMLKSNIICIYLLVIYIHVYFLFFSFPSFWKKDV